MRSPSGQDPDPSDAKPADMPDAKVDIPRIEKAVREILFAVGENPDREGLVKTPNRVARADGGAEPDRRRVRDRSGSHVHDDPRRQEARQHDGHQRPARDLQGEPVEPQRDPFADAFREWREDIVEPPRTPRTPRRKTIVS